MKKFSLKIIYKRAAGIMAIVINAVLFVVAPPNDFGDWFLQIVEFIAFAEILMTSWKWNSLPMALLRFQKLSQRD